MGRFTHDGVVYDELPDGNVRVVGYAQQSAPTVVPPNAAQASRQAAAEARAALSSQQESEKRGLEIQQLRDKIAAEKPVQLDPKLDGLTGENFVKHLPAQQAAQVRALADGRMAFPSGAAMRSPYWQSMLANVAHFDPSFDSVNFQARQAARKDFTSGKSAQNIRALNTAIGHLGQLNDQISGTASHGGFPFATTVNAIENALKSSSGNPGPGLYDQTAGAVSSELTQVFRGSSGAEADVKRYLEELSSSASYDQKRAAVRNIAGLLNSRLEEIGSQYSQGLGKTTDPLKLLNPHAQETFAKLRDGGGTNGHGNAPPPPGNGTSNPGEWKFNDQIHAKSTDGMPKLSPNDEAEISRNARYMTPDAMVKWFADRKVPIAPENARQVYDYYAKGGTSNPAINYNEQEYRAKLEEENKRKPIPGYTDLMQNGFAAGGLPTLAGLGGGVASMVEGDGFSKGYTFNRDAQRLALEQLRARSGIPGALAEGAGIVTGALAIGGAGARALPSVAKVLPAGVRNLAGDMTFGGLYGANEAAPGGTIGGAAGGALSAGAGNLTGQVLARPAAAVLNSRPAMAATNKVRGMFGRGPINVPPALSPAEAAVYSAANKAGIPDVQSKLADAQGLNVPMTLADTHPELRELAAAAVRRSPTASQHAESVLIPRSRGQIDRFGQAVERDLGPVSNIPQLSDDLIQQARAKAGPLYDQAYAGPAVTTPELTSLLNTPFGNSAISRAHTIAANERVDPSKLGFSLDANGSPALNPVPQDALKAVGDAEAAHGAAQDALIRARTAQLTGGNGNVAQAEQAVAQAKAKLDAAYSGLTAAPIADNAATIMGYTPKTLDYVKRGMDDVLEQYRNPITNRMQLDEAGRAQNGVRQQFLSEVDKYNPAYAQARAAYAGPASEKDAMFAGQRAFTADPNTLGVELQGQSPERIGQMQVGYRGQLMDTANKVRYSSNPFDATLGTPAAQARLSTIHPDNPGVQRLLSQREMENGLARTTNDILGNSKTAQRGIADSAFDEGGMGQMALDAGLNIATGQVPIGLLMKRGAMSGMKDAWKMGVGKRAVAKADALTPILLNADPVASAASLDALAGQDAAYREFLKSQRARVAKPLRMFGAGVGLTLSQ